MLFDLEIPPSLVDIVYIKQGEQIHSSLVPISYCNIIEKNVTPSDLIEIEEDARFMSFASSDIQVIASGAKEYTVSSDKFLLTHVKRYSSITGTDVPLFYKHVIAGYEVSGIPVDSIRVYDANGVALGLDQFVVQYYDKTIEVYLNPIKDNILSIQYTVQDGLQSELIKLEPIFTQVEWDYVITRDDLSMFEYLYDGATLYTKYTGIRYLVYQKNISLFNKPIAGINESWYLRIENVAFSIGSNNYTMPEYNIQQLGYGLRIRSYSNISAKILNDKYIQLQDNIEKRYLESVNIYLKNTNTDQIEYMFTMDSKKENTVDKITGLRWLPVSDYNSDGIFKLPVTIQSYHLATSDFTTPNKYYELRTLDLNSEDINSSKIIGIFIVPTDTSSTLMMTIFYCYIGVYDSSSNATKINVNGSGFKDKKEYRDVLSLYGCAHLAYVSLSSSKMIGMTEFYDARDFNGGILNRAELSKTDFDIVIDDIRNNNINIPIGDALVASVDQSVFAVPRNSKDNLQLIADKNDQYIQFIKDTLQKNLDVSTDVIIKNLGV